MKSLVITGNKSLKGTILVSGAKNSALPLLASSIALEEGIFVLENVPSLYDVCSMQELLSSFGCIVQTEKENNEHSSLRFSINSEFIDNFVADYNIVSKFRASILTLAPLLIRFKKAKIALPGGCAIGTRPVDLHLKVLNKMGANIAIHEGFILADMNSRFHSCEFNFGIKSVGATITAILAAVLANGTSYFSNCAVEPEIQDLCQCLNKMGAQIYNIGNSNIKISGVKKLFPVTHKIISDRIEAGTYMIAASITGGDITLKNIDPKFLIYFTEKIRETGSNIEVFSNSLRVYNPNKNILPINISTTPYPGFVTDLQAQFTSLMSLSTGTSEVIENIFENRFMHVSELNRMGANIKLSHNKAIIKGVHNLEGTEVIASDLRASAALVLAALSAFGKSKIHKIHHLKRGYQDIEEKLKSCGAEIEEVSEFEKLYEL